MNTGGYFGARGRSRTGTAVKPRDFKSLVSTCSTTRAKVFEDPCSARTRGIGGWGRNRTGVHGFAGRCMTTLPPSPGGIKPETPGQRRGVSVKSGAGNEARTRDLNLGKVALYQLSYSRGRRQSGGVIVGMGSALSSLRGTPHFR